MVPTLLAPALGPVIGGALVDGLSWRWIFYINLPVGVAALLVGALFLSSGSEYPPGRFDVPGFLLAATGFPLTMFALSTGSSSGWASASVVGTAVPGLVLLAAFVVVEHRTPEPLLRLRLYANRLYRTTTLHFGFSLVPSQTANMAQIAPEETGHASTLQNTVRQAGSAAGVALLGTVIAATGASAGDLAGYHLAFIAAASLMLLAALTATLIHNTDAASTMAPAQATPTETPLPEPA